MNIILRIPDAIASRLAGAGADLERQALEAWVIDSFRLGRMSLSELRETLGMTSVNEVDGFLKAHEVYLPYDLSDLEADRATFDRLGV